MKRPPGAILLLFTFGAGLATGLARFPDPRVVLFASLAGAAVCRWGVGFVLLVGLAGGTLLGSVSRHHREARCATAIRPGVITLRVRLDEAASAGGWTRAGVVGARCHGTIRLRWPEVDGAAAGVVLDARGRWIVRDPNASQSDGMLLVTAIELLPAIALRLTDRVHNAVTDRARPLFGSRAPLVDALVTGRRSELASDLRDAFAAAGLVHLLAISGFHVGLIGGWLLLVLRLATVSRHRAEGIAVFLILGYVAFLGWPAPATRAACLLALIAWTRWRQRQVAPLALLGTTCLAVVITAPSAVFDVGGWLSASALGGALVLSRWSDRVVGRRWWWRTLAASTGATLATAPITAFAFGQVAMIGIVLNLVAIPLTAAAVPGVLASLLLVPIAPTLAAAFAAAAGSLLALVEQVARVGAAVPLGHWVGEPGGAAAVPWLCALIAGFSVVRGGATLGEAGRRSAWLAVGTVWVLLAHGMATAGVPVGLTLDFLDVGQGDATMIRTPHGRWIAIDAGPAGAGSDAGRRVVVPFLRRHGARRIDVFVLSHAHRDHVGGASALLGAMPVTLAVDPGITFGDDTYLQWLTTLAAGPTRWHVATAGDAWTIDGVGFRVLHPGRDWPGRGLDLNEDSIVLEVRYGDFVALLTGDAGLPAEAEFQRGLRPVTLLKVGHHGSRGATGESLLVALRPQMAVVSLGRNNYGHPSPTTMQRLAAAGVPAWRTDHEGTIAVHTDGHTVKVRGRRTRATFAALRRTRPRRRRARPDPGHHPRTLHSRPGTLPSRRHRRAHEPPV